MKNATITILLLILFGVLALVFTTFQVRETESALVIRLGRPSRELKQPGLYLKWPPPIEWVEKFDSRARVLEADVGQTSTKGAVPVIIHGFIIWRVAEPLAFYNAVGTVTEAETKLLSHIMDTQSKVIGQHNFSEFVNSDPEKIRFEQIESEMAASLKQAVGKTYGISIEDVGIRQLKVSEDVSKDVFERMSAERRRITDGTIAEGIAAARKIMTDANSIKIELLAAAEARAKAIRAQGDAEAAGYYQLLEADPDLAMFLRDLDSLKTILEKRSTIVIGADTEPFKLLRQMPAIEPKK